MFAFSLAESVRGMFAFSIFLSCGIQFYIPIQIMGPRFREFFSSNSSVRKHSDSILRVAVVSVSCT